MRLADHTDLDRLLELAIAFYAEDGFTTPPDVLRSNLRTLLDSAAARVAVIDGDGAGPVAFAVTTTSFGLENGLIAELEDLYVAPEARMRGLARELIADSAAWAASIGCGTLEIVIAPNGQDVSHLERFYTHLGFQDDGRVLRHLALDGAGDAAS